MLQSGLPLQSTLLKAGHHGSRTSTTEPFINAVRPQFSVISDGRDNHFGHPRSEMLERMQQHHVRTYRTDMMGAITFLLDAEGRVTASALPR